MSRAIAIAAELKRIPNAYVAERTIAHWHGESPLAADEVAAIAESLYPDCLPEGVQVEGGTQEGAKGEQGAKPAAKVPKAAEASAKPTPVPKPAPRPKPQPSRQGCVRTHSAPPKPPKGVFPRSGKPSFEWWEGQAQALGLKRVGAELKGPCPACGGDDRFWVSERGFFCRHCAPSAGAAGFRAILEAAGWTGERTEYRPPAPPKPQGSKTYKYARRLLAESKPIAGTPAEAYLNSRDLGESAGNPAFRYHHDVRTRGGGRHPALLAAIRPAFDGIATGCQAVLLDQEGRKADDVDGGPKRTFGMASGGAIWLGEKMQDVVVIAEGVENALSAALLFGREADNAHPVAAIGTAGLAKWRKPDWCQRVVIAADMDGPGTRAAFALEKRLQVRCDIRWMLGDANDELRKAGRF